MPFAPCHSRHATHSHTTLAAIGGPVRVATDQPAPTSISVVCVYNDPAVRVACLDRSLESYLTTGNSHPDIEYIPVDNVNGTYRTAGAALNYGASVAKNRILVFVHQDVFIHSVEAVIEAAGEMERRGFGVLGAVGVRRAGRVVGSVRDRTVLLGDPVTEPADVDSVDELLFMVPRQLVMREPLTECPDMAWHAYAVEYGLRVRRLGLRVGVADIPVTHNSLTTNLAGLGVAHASVAARYRDMMPVRTTCGVVTKGTVIESHRAWLAAQGARYRRIGASLAAARNVHACGHAPLLHADIRVDIDDIVSRSPGGRLYIINLTAGKRFAGGDGFLELKRCGNTIAFIAGELSELPLILARCRPDAWLLIADMTLPDVRQAAAGFGQRDFIIGFGADTGYWVLTGPGSADLPRQWHRPILGLRRQPRLSRLLSATVEHWSRTGGVPTWLPVMPRRPGSIGTRTADDRGPGLPDDLEVEGKRPVLDVAEVEP